MERRWLISQKPDFRALHSYDINLDKFSVLWYNKVILQELRWKDAWNFLLNFDWVYEAMAVVPSVLVCPAGTITVFSHNISTPEDRFVLLCLSESPDCEPQYILRLFLFLLFGGI